MKKYMKIFGINVGIGAVAIVLYSPGLLALRVTDYSIFRAGMSIIAGVILAAVFLYVNVRFLRGPKPGRVDVKEISDIESAKRVLRQYHDGKYFGQTARTVSEQMDRIVKCGKRLSGVLEQKFEKGTMSWEKFNSVVESAENSAIQNAVTMANRMQMFDEREYSRLQHYRQDDIPDDIQEEQIRLYQKNLDNIRSAITLNERLLLKLDTLALEVSGSSTGTAEGENQILLGEIEQLTKEIKYYN